MRRDGSRRATGAAAARHVEHGDLLAVVGASGRRHALEGEVIAGQRQLLARLHDDDALLAVGAGGDDADDQHADAEMRQRRADGRARQIDEAPPGLAQRHAAEAYAPGEIGHGAGHDEDAERDAERRQPGTALIHGQRQHHDADGQHGREHQPLRRAQHVAALPGEERPERQRQQQRHHQRPERPVEIRRADGDLVAGERFQQQRIERADEHRGARRRQQDVVEDEGAFAADGREDAALAQVARAPGEQRQAAAGEQRHDGEDEDAALRIDGERVHRGEHARSARGTCPSATARR